MAFHWGGLEHVVAGHPGMAATIIVVMIVVIVFLALVAVAIYAKYYIKHARVSADLVKQKECTQTAERRSLNKSSAIATASHDIRGSLGGITSMIEMCYDHVPSGSKVEDNLRLMHRFANDLLGLLNTLLDTSKIEAGRMELEEDEFNLAQLLEEVADFYHPMAMKKGVEVVLDLCDGSVAKFGNVRGDRIKLKQIISNLVSNAVKFTPKGSTSIRAWAKKPSLETTILASRPNRYLNWISRVFFKEAGIHNLKAITTPQQNPNCMEYVIEVDDTGKGIPKDKQKAVFENFVQVRDSSLGHHGGTGLGLGIVQSLVRLMGGDIWIADKEPGKEGTCFKFNIFLEASDNGASEKVREGDIEAPAGSSQQMAADAPAYPHKVDGSSVVVLLIHNHERRRVVRKYMEGKGVKVSVVRHWQYLQGHLRRMGSTMYLSQNSSSSKSDYTSQSDCYITGRQASRRYGKELPLSSLEGTDEVKPGAGSRRVNKGAPTFIMFLIDVTAGSGPLQEMVSVVEEFRSELCNVSSKVIWLEKPCELCKGLAESLQPEDAIISKPLHGSRLLQVLKILPEFGGISTLENGEANSRYRVKGKAKGIRIQENNNSEIMEEEDHSSGSEEIQPIRERRARGYEQANGSETGLSNGLPPLSGLKILVAEDCPMLASLAHKLLSLLGAVVNICGNGRMALEAVVRGLSEKVPEGSSRRIPFDLILMDCEMPEMNGFEATREIRRVEQPYGVHIPIIALTAHISDDQVEETALAGMDAYLAKPINCDALKKTIARVCPREMAP
uniref:histidine kinase n=1 Tax=Kalanchoe fedtschenkoi TaxID=63787 RepID=A0A7N0VII8_KALFE